jgi:porphobilinogen synthase
LIKSQLNKNIFLMRERFMKTAPYTRDRRLRLTPWRRSLTAETSLSPADLILPVFVHDEAENTPIPGLGQAHRLSLKGLVGVAKAAHKAGIPALALFPVVKHPLKNSAATEALNADSILCRALKAVKDAVPELGLIADIALDPYTDHGHDGLLENGQLANDATVDVLTQQALILARAGADAVAPSDMMDGRVASIRAALEAENLFDTLIISYAAKFASRLYAPFRGAVGAGGLQAGPPDKLSYQLPPGNGREAVKEALRDAAEGADMLIVKPGLPYLDIVAALKNRTELPLISYIVSGECAMLHAAAAMGAADFLPVLLEQLICCKRAGASAIITYDALAAAQAL